MGWVRIHWEEKIMKDPMEGKEIKFETGFVYFPSCKECGSKVPGFHISYDGKAPTIAEVFGASCTDCGSEEIDWNLESYSKGKVILKKGWKRKKK